jgi:hypothetical protein
MDAEDARAWPDELDRPEAWARALEEDGDWVPERLSPGELTAWDDDADAEEVGPGAAETAWRALRLMEQEEAGRGGWDLVEAAQQAGAGDDLACLSDAEVIGRAVKCREVIARAQGRMYRTLEELLRRRPPAKRYRRGERVQERRDDHDGITDADGAPRPPRLPVMASREAASEVAMAFTSTEYAAERLVEQAADLSRRLPAALEALEAGRTYPDRVLILWEATADLSDEDAGRVDTMLSDRSGQLTTGELRDEVRRAVIRIDPAAADRRRKRNEKKSRVRLYPNPDHTATLAVEQAPAVLAAAAMARISALSRAAKSAGADEPLTLLGSKIALGLLLGTLPLIPPHLPPDGAAGPPDDEPGSDGPRGDHGRDDGPGDGGPGGDGPGNDGPGDGGPGGNSPGGNSPGGDGPGGRAPGGQRPGDWGDPPGEPGESMPWPAIPATAGATAPGCAPLPAWARAAGQGHARLLLPWRTMAGMASQPGELSWFGPITPGQARDLAQAAAADPAVRWIVIITDDNGRATAVTALRSRRGSKTAGLIDEVTVTITAALADGLASDDATRHWTQRLLASVRTTAGAMLAGVLERTLDAARDAVAAADIRAAADQNAGGCAHTLAVAAYRVPATLRRWLNARDRTCRNPVCRRRATQCDQDHTRAHDKGGPTCTCNLGPLCRRHHQLKQLRGWHLTQDTNGTFTWTTPAGLTYRKEPHTYLV